MKRCILSMALLALVPGARAVTLEDYLQALRDHHPLIRREQLAGEVEDERRGELQGAEDWLFTARPSYEYDEPVDPSFAASDEVRTSALDVGLSRSFWSSGGQLDIGYNYSNQRAESDGGMFTLGSGQTIDVTRPPLFFANAVSVRYTQPLLRNRGGEIDRLAYDLQGYTADQARLLAMENEEAFLLQLGLRFLDWVQLTEEMRIGERRLQLAEEDRDRSRSKYEENLVERVDLLRAEDAVHVTRQAIKRVESLQLAVREELARQAAGSIDIGTHPSFDLDRLPEIPSPDAFSGDGLDGLRAVRVIDLRLAQLEREQSGLLDNKQADLDLIVFGNVKDGDEDYSGSTDFDQTSAGIALAYARPLKNTSAESAYRRSALEAARAGYQRDAVRLELEAGIRSLAAEMTSLADVLEINLRQIETAMAKTAEEQKLYEQGRNQFTFVIQSQDAEARARLEYVRNAVTQMKLGLQLDALLDRIVTDADAP